MARLNRLLEVGMGRLDRAGDVVDLVMATEDTALGIVEHGVFMKNLVDRRASARGIDLAKYIVGVPKQQGRYGVGRIPE